MKLVNSRATEREGGRCVVVHSLAHCRIDTDVTLEPDHHGTNT